MVGVRGGAGDGITKTEKAGKKKKEKKAKATKDEDGPPARDAPPPPLADTRPPLQRRKRAELPPLARKKKVAKAESDESEGDPCAASSTSTVRLVARDELPGNKKVSLENPKD